ncbi:hypothetical protein FRB90_012150 [Tulasnella sp. 427]|nr:hypothetical protein FRB90_012150 [Tulasnella sp. 427]
MAATDPNHQGRTLILCFDGTGDSFDDDNTNIVRFFTALEKNKPEQQLCYYQPGIGTYVSPAAAWSPTLKRIAEKIDFAVAWYLDTHVGLLPRSNEEQVSFAYAKYIDTSPGNRIRAAGFKAAFSTPVDIEFMGVWDTVSSVGIKGRHLPFTSSNTIIRSFRHALSLDERRAKFQPNPWHKPATTKAAAQNDPECGTAVYDKKGLTRLQLAQKWFTDVMGGDETATAANGKGKSQTKKSMNSLADIPQQSQGPGGCRPMADTGDVEDVYWNGAETDVKEVWFSGCHTDVGGGSVKNEEANRLANISLCWMLNEIVKAKANIFFKDNAFSDVAAFQILLNTGPVLLPSPSFPNGVASASEPRRQEMSEATVVDSPVQERTAELSHNKELSTGTIGNSTIASVQETAMVQDSTSALHDALAKLSIWWILELLPQRHAWQDTHGHWKKGWYFNLGRPRQIQEPNPRFHSSVKLRMDRDSGYQPKAKYIGTVEYVD